LHTYPMFFNDYYLTFVSRMLQTAGPLSGVRSVTSYFERPGYQVVPDTFAGLDNWSFLGVAQFTAQVEDVKARVASTASGKVLFQFGNEHVVNANPS
jgi:hypothetical protein